ncbi:MAG: hypothetical protein QN163_09420 [Armatimonadota bacterium]|nr:hypothetical protein [Armatimonadota bacterium]MDR5697396.1 hypothetical protein [Armatimonadota bacterium]
MTIREVLLAHIRRTYEEEAWQPSPRMAVEWMSAMEMATHDTYHTRGRSATCGPCRARDPRASRSSAHALD